MKHHYPDPHDVGIKIPAYLMQQRFRNGFAHALQGYQITMTEHLRLSFREGYRAGKLYLRELRRHSGVINFPCQGKILFKVIN